LATLTVLSLTSVGNTPNFVAAAAGGDEFVNSDKSFFAVKNGGGGSINVTVAIQRSSFDIPGFGRVGFSALVIAVPPGEERYIKVPPGPYNDPNTGRVEVTYSAVTSVTVAAIQVPVA